MKTALIGHRQIFVNNLDVRLIAAIKTEIERGCNSFIMGAQGQFDALALRVCKQLRKEYTDLDIEVVLTSLHVLDRVSKWGNVPYFDVKTVMYDIDGVYFEQQISMNNRRMIDECDTLICYIDEKYCISGAKRAMCYAEKNDLKIVNLWREEDNPFYGMTPSEVSIYLKKALAKIRCKNDKSTLPK